MDYRRHDNWLEYEIREEQAATLGRLGRVLESTLVQLRSLDTELRTEASTAAARRAALVEAAAQAMWHYIIQREALGLTDHSAVYRILSVPVEVLRRMGAGPAPPGNTAESGE